MTDTEAEIRAIVQAGLDTISNAATNAKDALIATGDKRIAAAKVESADLVIELAKAMAEARNPNIRDIDKTWSEISDYTRESFELGANTALDFLTTAGRLVPEGGMLLTAEQVEDVRTVAWYTGAGLSRAPLAEIHRLRALFPATEPAAVRDGSDLVVVQRSHTAKAVQSWMTLDLWTDLGKNDKDFDAEYERRGFGELWSVLLGEVRALVQATEPAEEPAREGDCALPPTHDGPCVPAPAVPAEEETKAEEETALLCSHPMCRHTNWGGRNRKHLRFSDCPIVPVPASSPVVPAPTETGPWTTWEAVPDGVKYRETPRRPMPGQWWWVNRNGIRNLADICGEEVATTIVNPVGPFSPVAPFVAAEEKDA